MNRLPTNRLNQANGRAAARSGARFEDMIERANVYYSRRATAQVLKVPTGTRPIGKRGGQTVWAPAEKTGCDYVGVLNGKGVAFEAKSTRNKTSFPLTVHQKDMVKPHQLQFLREYQAAGGAAFILIHFSETGRTFRTSVDAYDELTERARKEDKKSLPIGWIEEASLEVYQRAYFIDYLPKEERENHE